ncbi:NUDIX hydrolase [Sphingomonas oligophenolica]|uniref:NUDIX domain-containing protein n=1 Tax=Sphingomonas oligophenolica TaxID=301154 RepID=A0A502CU65_9SPHN|nr:NUDIX domain-containing protein [Sphingomonas oligophenolica]TPG15281.1 NUDIX domain-containing protein [Sphingomonas oligophenolica]
MSDSQTPIPAATLVIFRDAADGPPELLMVERAKQMVFAGGAWVFPGGRIDPGDYALADTLAPQEDGASRIAAIRETIEEAGLPVGLDPLPSPDALAALRAALHDGQDFAVALAAAGTALDCDLLHPFARWLPAHAHMRIFDTRFFLARLPADAPCASVDETENVRLRWTTAQALLDDADAGRAAIIFPTRRNLERLALYRDFDAAVADARAHPVRTITPYLEERDGAPHLCIPDDLGYPVTSEIMTGVLRG